MCCLLVQYGAPFESVHLCIAAQNENEDLCSFFLENNSLDKVLADGFNPFTFAAADGKTAAMTFLLRYIQGNPLYYLSEMNEEGQTPLSESATNRKIAAVRWLLERGVTADRTFIVRNRAGTITFEPAGHCYSLHEAAAKNALKTAQLLIERGRANLNFSAQHFSINSFDGTPLHTAAERGCHRMCVLLCDYGGYRNIFAKGISGRDTLRFALKMDGLVASHKSTPKIANTCRALIENALEMPGIPAQLPGEERERTQLCSREIKNILCCLRATCPSMPADLRIRIVTLVMPEKVFELFRPYLDTILRLHIECKRNQNLPLHECFIDYKIAVAKIPLRFRQFLVDTIYQKTKESVAKVLTEIKEESITAGCHLFRNEPLTDPSVAERLNPSTLDACFGIAMRQVMKTRLGFVNETQKN